MPYLLLIGTANTMIFIIKERQTRAASAVVVVCLYVFPYRVRYKVFQRLPGLHLASDISGGNIQERGIQLGNIGTMLILYLKTGAAVDHERITAHQLLKVLPAVYVLEAVRAHNHGKLLQRELLGKIGKSVNSIGWLWQVELHITGPELRVILYGEVNKMQPVVLVKQRVGVF